MEEQKVNESARVGEADAELSRDRVKRCDNQYFLLLNVGQGSICGQT